MTRLLTLEQESTLRAALRARLAGLLEEIRGDLQKSDDDRTAMLADRVRDVGDESLADLVVDLDLADTDRDLAELKEVDAALTRLRLGTYGTCVHCGAPIPLGRLTAWPAAARCEPCQRLHEKTFAHPAQPTL